jgi:site-specific DNA recombinase
MLRYIDEAEAARCEVEELLTNRRMQLADMEMVMRCVEDLRGLLSQGSLSERKAFIRSFVKEVRVTGKEVLILYTMNLPPDGATHERSGVLSIVHDGGAEGTRTPDLLRAREALSQLSYSPFTVRRFFNS